MWFVQGHSQVVGLPRFASPQLHIPSDVIFSAFMHERGVHAGTYPSRIGNGTGSQTTSRVC